MPPPLGGRIARSLLKEALKLDPLLPILLQPCRDLDSAQAELRWLKEHAIRESSKDTTQSWQKLLTTLVKRRGRGYPLQYILGSEYAGPLEIICKPGVLIPRPETTASVLYLLNQFRSSQLCPYPQLLQVLDLCSGSGVVTLLFAHEFPYLRTKLSSSGHLKIIGIDITREAISLGRHNQNKLHELLKSKTQLRTQPEPIELEWSRNMALSTSKFAQADIFESESRNANVKGVESLTSLLSRHGKPPWHIVVCNPPYISPKGFSRINRSVRTYEPRIALVPEARNPDISDQEQGDLFYPRLLEIAQQYSTKILLMEVADMKQAERVASMAKATKLWDGIEIWRDEPGYPDSPEENGTLTHSQWREHSLKERINGVKTIGRGIGRSVFCWRDEAGHWLGRKGDHAT